MRRIFGFPVLAAGVALGAYSTFPRLFDPSPVPFAALSQVASEAPLALGNTQDQSLVRQNRLKMFAPSTAFRVAALALPNAAALVPPAPKPALRPERSPALETASVSPLTASETTTISAWQPTVVTAEGVADARLRKTASPLPVAPRDRDQLAREIQRELKRVGCYGGAIDGSWGSSSKRAMSVFMDRANATLPLEAPDDILLSLIKGHASAACGAGCPKGQSLSGEGRCIPAAMVAQSARKGLSGQPLTPVAQMPARSAGPQVAWTAVVTPAAPGSLVDLPHPQPLPGRMGMGAPLPDTVNPLKTAALVESGQIENGSGNAVEPPAAEQLAPVNPAPARASRPQGRQERGNTYRRGTRSVQNIFMHPLGRM